MILDITMAVILISVLIMGALYDVFNDMTVPVSIPVFAIAVRIIEMIVIEKITIYSYIMIAFITFVVLLLFAIFFGLGGSDVLFGTVIVLYQGSYGILCIILSMIIAIPFAFVREKKEIEGAYPFLPFMAIAGIVVQVLLLQKIWYNIL